MSWIKLDDDTFALESTPDPQEIVVLSEKEAEKKSIEERIENIEMLEYPEEASEDLKEAIDIVNLKKQRAIDLLELELDEVTKLLEEICQFK